MPTISLVDLTNPDEVRACFPVFNVLRPHLDEDEFVARVTRQAAETYQIVCIREGRRVVAAAGYRIAHFLWSGKTLYIDDLITDPAETRRGLAGALLDWLIAESARSACVEIHLDSGYQRHDAHRLYLNKGFRLACHHFSRPV